MPTTSVFTEMTALAARTGAVNLGQGFPDEDGPEEIVSAAIEAIRAGHNQYAPLPGVAALREAIAAHQLRRYGIELDPDGEVQVTFGATEAAASALLALVGAGEEVVMLDPAYDAYGPVVERAGARPVGVALEPPEWRLDPEALARAVTSRTRVLLLNSPHNPTGRVFDRSELEAVAAVCLERDLIAVTDEVYEHLVFDGKHIPLATLEGMAQRTVTISSLGKTHSLTGWKVGWASGPAALIERLRAVKQFLTFAGATPFQHAAAVALDMDVAAADLAARLRVKRDRLAAGLAQVGFEVLPTEGTYFLNADAAPLGWADATRLCRELPEQAGVAAIPLAAFSVPDPARVASKVRFAFCKREGVLDEAVERLAAWARSPAA